jgi:hypothetical protein
MHCLVRFAHGFLTGSGHQAEGFAFLQVHMRGVRSNSELRCGLLQQVELGKKLRFG